MSIINFALLRKNKEAAQMYEELSTKAGQELFAAFSVGISSPHDVGIYTDHERPLEDVIRGLEICLQTLKHMHRNSKRVSSEGLIMPGNGSGPQA